VARKGKTNSGGGGEKIGGHNKKVKDAGRSRKKVKGCLSPSKNVKGRGDKERGKRGSKRRGL